MLGRPIRCLPSRGRSIVQYSKSSTLASALSIGAHGADFDIQDLGTSPQTVTLNTTVSGSTIIVAKGGLIGGSTNPTYNGISMGTALRSSVYIGDMWSGYGLELHGLTNVSGGTGHLVSVTKSTPVNESTLMAVEIKGGLTIQDTSIVARGRAGAGVSYTSNSVVTTGPAILVAFWGGDGETITNPQSASPESGWTMLDSLFVTATSYVQMASAYKAVNAGTHTVTWTPDANQGAVLILVAVQV